MAGPTLPALVLLALSMSPRQDLERIFQRFHQGFAEESVAEARAIVAERPEDPVGHHLLGRFAFHQGRFDEAVSELTKCLELDPKESWQVAWTHLVLGQSLAALHREDEARVHLRRAFEMDATKNCTQLAARELRALGESVGDAEAQAPSPWIGQPMPDLWFEGLAGEPFRTSEQRGTPRLYQFGPTW